MIVFSISLNDAFCHLLLYIHPTFQKKRFPPRRFSWFSIPSEVVTFFPKVIVSPFSAPQSWPVITGCRDEWHSEIGREEKERISVDILFSKPEARGPKLH